MDDGMLGGSLTDVCRSAATAICRSELIGNPWPQLLLATSAATAMLK